MCALTTHPYPAFRTQNHRIQKSAHAQILLKNWAGAPAVQSRPGGGKRGRQWGRAGRGGSAAETDPAAQDGREKSRPAGRKGRAAAALLTCGPPRRGPGPGSLHPGLPPPLRHARPCPGLRPQSSARPARRRGRAAAKGAPGPPPARHSQPDRAGQRHTRPDVAPGTKTFLEPAKDGTDATRTSLLFSDRCPG